MTDVSIVIVNWNTRPLMEGCLHSLYQSGDVETSEVIVVDNASSDDSVAMLQQHFPQVRLISNPTNLGFARANNQGILHSVGRYVLLLNSDTIVFPGALPALLAFMEAHPLAGAAGARLLNPDGSLQYSCSPAPTILREFLRLFHLPSVRADGYYPMEKWDLRQPRRVDVILGACMFLRREALDQVGLMDEDYFMYSEEVDLCHRLRKAGWELYWVPQAQVVHLGGQSTQQVADEMFLRLYASKLLFFRKTYGRSSARIYKAILWAASLFRLSLTPLAWLEAPEPRRRHLIQARFYRRLLASLPDM